jgi:exopolysaccharide biosynthesis WecB/TagA/CpsF family protein
MATENTADKTISVAFYMHDFAGGGVERMRLVLFAALPSRGVAPSVIVQARRGVLAGAVPASVPVITLGTRRTLGDIVPLARLLRQRRFDIVVGSLDHNNIVLLLATLIAGRRTPVIICQHNALSAETGAGWKYRLVPLLYRLLWRLADGVLAVSEGVAGDLARVSRIPRSAISVVYNPVVGADLANPPELSPPHSWLADGTRRVFVFVGRLTAQKDPETLLRAFSLLRQRSSAHLILVGEGELTASLVRVAAESGVADYVHFAGFQPDPRPWIARASALVLSSRYEGLGNVIIEALACGTPVIATDCPFGPAEILQGGRLGQLVPPGDPDALAAAMEQLGRQTVTADERRARAADFTVKSCVDRHVELFAHVSRQRVRGRKVFGLSICTLDAAGCVARIVAPQRERDVRLVVTPNINHLRLLRRPGFAQAYAQAELVCVDGFPLLLYARSRGVPLGGRVTGCDILRLLIRYPGLPLQRLFLVVESVATARAAQAWARARDMPSQIAVAVAVPGLADDISAQHSLANAITAHGTTILVMTLGAPVSEVFVHRNRDRLPPCWALCVGQALRIELGLVRRAPSLMRAAGLEWAWRIWQEPRRLCARYVLDALWFPAAVLRELCLGQHTWEDSNNV